MLSLLLICHPPRRLDRLATSKGSNSQLEGLLAFSLALSPLIIATSVTAVVVRLVSTE
jgi:hypothetical protein